MLVYSAARHVVPVVAASAVGIAAAALGNFVVGDRLVFRSHAIGITAATSGRSANHADKHTPTKEVAA
jgi:putative flippase GtrA